MGISTTVQSKRNYGIPGKRDEEVPCFVFARVEHDIVLAPDQVATPGDTISAAMLSTMRSGNCFKCPKLFYLKNERKIRVASVNIYHN
jgi:hypothetical protein